MIQTIKINLLPYREALLQKRKQHFKNLMLLGVLAGVGLAAFGYVSLNTMIGNQEERNQVLQEGIKKLDTEIAEIEKLKIEKANFLARKQKVEELENQRFEAARIIDSLNALIPEGVYLTGIDAKDELNYQISGKAISDNKIAVFMRAIPSTGLFQTPELVSIQKENEAQVFTLQVALARQLSINAQAASTPAK